MSEDYSRVSWNKELELYFRETAEKAHGRGWCHKRSESIFTFRRTLIDLPVIVGSGIVAFLNAGSTSLFKDPMTSSVALGVGSLIIGVLNTLGTYYNWSKRAEGHRIASIHYDRHYRFIRIQMALPRDERMTPPDLLKAVKDTEDRLQETSPILPNEVINEFQSKFGSNSDIAKPEETNGLECVKIFKESSLAPLPTSPAVIDTDRPENLRINIPDDG